MWPSRIYRAVRCLCHLPDRAIAFLIPFALLTGVLLSTGQAQKLDESISEPEAKAVISLSKVLASVPTPIVNGLIERVGYKPAHVPTGWSTFPVVRKLETIYLAAEQSSPRQGSAALAVMAQHLAQLYEGAKYDPYLKPYIALPKPQNLTFAATIQSQLPAPDVQKAILAMSRYTERGQLGGAAGVLQYHFNLPPEIAYQILRSSPSDAIALSHGLARVSQGRRQAALESLVAHADSAFPDTAPGERDLDPYRPARKRPALVTSLPDEHLGVPPVAPPSPPFPPGDKPGEGTGPVDIIPPVIPRSGPPSGTPSSAEKAYSTRVSEWYGSAGIGFESMVAVEGGAGGIVFGSPFLSHIRKPLSSFEYLHLTATEGTTEGEGQLIFHFSDGSEAVYGPVNQGDVQAAAGMIFGNGVSKPTFHEGNGFPLLGIENHRDYFDIVGDKIKGIGVVWNVVVHPSLVYVPLGRSVLMADVLPIGDEDGRQNLEKLIEQYDKTKMGFMRDAFPGDVDDWKITDSPITLELDNNSIVVKNSNTQSSNQFLSIREYREDDKDYDPELSTQFAKFATTLVGASVDYKRLSDFVPVFGLFRWAHSQNAKALNLPSSQSGDAIVPSMVAVQDDGIRLIFGSSETSPLKALEAKISRRLADLRGSSSQTLQSGLVAIEAKHLYNFAIQEQIESENSRFLEENMRYYRLDERLQDSSIFSPHNMALAEAKDDLQEIVEDAEDADSEADVRKFHQAYSRQDAKVIALEIRMNPSQAALIRERHAGATRHDWNLVPLYRRLQTGTPTSSEGVYDEVIALLPEESRHQCQELRKKSQADLETGNREVYEAERALANVDKDIRDYLGTAPKAIRDEYSKIDDDDAQAFDSFLSRSAPQFLPKRKEAEQKLEVARKDSLESRNLSKEDVEMVDERIKAMFPEFPHWVSLVQSIQVFIEPM